MNFNPDISVRLFEAQDAFDIVVRPEDEHIKLSPFFESWVETNALGAGFTGVKKSDGKILGIGGIKTISPGVGEAWALFCDEIGTYAKECREYARHYLSGLVKEMGLQRLQCIVYADEKLKVRFAKSLGFEMEGTMRKYQNGRDCVMFAMTADEVRPLALPISPAPFSVLGFRDKMKLIEDTIMEQPGAMMGDAFPLKHSFAKGLYVREIRVPSDVLLSGEIHKHSHAFFLLKGDVSFLTETGTKRIKAPTYFITPAGTKRIVFHHADTMVVTVHGTEETDVAKIREEILAPTWDDVPQIGGAV